jgi:hypothetical protein
MLHVINLTITINGATFANIEGTLRKNVEKENIITLKTNREMGKVLQADRTPGRTETI